MQRECGRVKEVKEGDWECLEVLAWGSVTTPG
jgi:hypothetical protein